MAGAITPSIPTPISGRTRHSSIRRCISPTFVPAVVARRSRCLESKTWYRRYGVSDRPILADYAEFERYWEQMINEVLVAHPTAKYGVGTSPRLPAAQGSLGGGVGGHCAVFNPLAAFLTTGGMPPRTREILGLPWDDRKDVATRGSPRCAGHAR